jgi:carbonic anhydrase
VVLTCADSRVPPELVFDEGLGDVFTVRIAGNTAADPFVVASIEYGVLVLGSILVFVLGHSDCGAVKGAIDVATKGAVLPGSIGDLIVPILPAVDANKNLPKDQLLEAATRSNVHLAITQLSAVPIIRDAISQGKLLVAGGEYELGNGKVEVVT